MSDYCETCRVRYYSTDDTCPICGSDDSADSLDVPKVLR